MGVSVGLSGRDFSIRAAAAMDSPTRATAAKIFPCRRRGFFTWAEEIFNYVESKNDLCRARKHSLIMGCLNSFIFLKAARLRWR